MTKNACLLSGFGLCVDSRDWCLKYVHPGTVADRLGTNLSKVLYIMTFYSNCKCTQKALCIALYIDFFFSRYKHTRTGVSVLQADNVADSLGRRNKLEIVI
jgi:hypothetical protein